MAATITYLSTSTSSSLSDSYTFTSVGLGTASADRVIGIVVTGEPNTGPAEVDSLTVAGVSAVKLAQIIEPTEGYTASLWVAEIPTGTSGNVVVNFNVQYLRCFCHLWAMTGVDASAVYASTTNADDIVNLNCGIPEGGVVFGAAQFAATNSVSTTGLTENYDVSFAGDRGVAGSAGPLSAEASRTISFNGGSGVAAGVVASFTPASSAVVVHAAVNSVVSGAGMSSISTGAFTPPDGCMLVAVVGSDGDNGTPEGGGISGGSLTWTRRTVAAQTDGTSSSCLEIYTAPVTIGSSMTVTWTPSNNVDVAILTVASVAAGIGVGATVQDGALSDPTGAMSLSASPSSSSLVIAARCLIVEGGSACDATPGAGWAELSNNAIESEAGINIQYRAGSTSSSVTWGDIDAPAFGGTVFCRFGGAVEITVGGTSVQPAELTNASQPHAPKVLSRVATSAVESVGSAYAASLRLAGAPSHFANVETLAAPLIRVGLRPPTLSNSPAFGEALVGAGQAVLPVPIAGGHGFYELAVRAAVGGAHMASASMPLEPALVRAAAMPALTDAPSFSSPRTVLRLGASTLVAPHQIYAVAVDRAGITNAPALEAGTTAFSPSVQIAFGYEVPVLNVAGSTRGELRQRQRAEFVWPKLPRVEVPPWRLTVVTPEVARRRAQALTSARKRARRIKHAREIEIAAIDDAVARTITALIAEER